MINIKSQTINTFLIVIGAAMLIYSLSYEQEEPYFQIGGLVLLMFGLYKSTQQWVSDNKRGDDENKDINEDSVLEDHTDKK